MLVSLLPNPSDSEKEEENFNKILLSHFPELRINSAGHGLISAEFLLPKSMWIQLNEPHIWNLICIKINEL
jgi:hypothetical protein